MNLETFRSSVLVTMVTKRSFDGTHVQHGERGERAAKNSEEHASLAVP